MGYLGAGAIQNLTLGESCSVTGGKYSGGVCGWNDAGAITGCTNKGAVNGKGDLGGVCGHNLGTVEKLHQQRQGDQQQRGDGGRRLRLLPYLPHRLHQQRQCRWRAVSDM